MRRIEAIVDHHCCVHAACWPTHLIKGIQQRIADCREDCVIELGVAGEDDAQRQAGSGQHKPVALEALMPAHPHVDTDQLSIASTALGTLPWSQAFIWVSKCETEHLSNGQILEGEVADMDIGCHMTLLRELQESGCQKPS